jgi:hypothetical protein
MGPDYEKSEPTSLPLPSDSADTQDTAVKQEPWQKKGGRLGVLREQDKNASRAARTRNSGNLGRVNTRVNRGNR